MKRSLLIAAALFCCLATRAQSSPDAEIRERIYVQTDKDRYLSGELVWMKLTTTTENGLPFSFSRVGYVELVDGKESRARTRIDISQGVGSGTLLLPADLPTGYYRLVGYTRYMRNEGPSVFFERWLGVVNPSLAEVTDGDRTVAAPDMATGSTGSGSGSAGFTAAYGRGLTVSTDRPSYSTRGEVRLDISGIPDDIHTLSVSVTARDLAGGYPSPGLARWKEQLSGERPASFSRDLEAEYEGAIITGRLISADTDEAVADAGVMPFVSYPGKDINIFNGKMDAGGNVTFYTSRASGFRELATSMQRGEGPVYRLDIDTPYARDIPVKPVPTFPLDDIDREAMLAQSLSMQLQYSYLNDSLNRTAGYLPHLLHDPDFRYDMDEWTRFSSMSEVVTEFIKYVRFERNNGRRQLSVVNANFIGSMLPPLVLLDGIAVFDHQIIYDYNPLLLSCIDVYMDRFAVGESFFNGIVALYTPNFAYPELRPDTATRILPYDSPQAQRVFYAPDHSASSQGANRLPDSRHTLYWNADVETGGTGHASVAFHTSDLKATYRVIVEGITASGEVVQAVCPLEVR